MKMINKRCVGFSLVEVMLGLVILTFGIYGVLQLQITSSNNSRQSHLKTEMSSVAETRLAQLKSAGFDALKKYIDENKSSPLTAEVPYPKQKEALDDSSLTLDGNQKIEWQSYLALSQNITDTVKVRMTITGTIDRGTKENSQAMKKEYIMFVGK